MWLPDLHDIYLDKHRVQRAVSNKIQAFRIFRNLLQRVTCEKISPMRWWLAYAPPEIPKLQDIAQNTLALASTLFLLGVPLAFQEPRLEADKWQQLVAEFT